MRNLLKIYKALPVQIKASFWFLVATVVQSMVSALATPIFTRLMTPSEYGEYNEIISWQLILNCIVSLNIYGGVYTQGLIKQENEKKNSYISRFIGLLSILTLISYVVYCMLNKIVFRFLSLNFFTVTMLFILIWTTGIFQLWSQAERSEYRYKKLIFISLAYTLTSTSLGIILVFFHKDKVSARLIGLVVPALFLYGMLFVFMLKKSVHLYDEKLWRHVISLSLPLVPHYLSQIILNSSDRIMISKINGKSETGIYSLAYSLAQMMTMFNAALLSTIEPWIYKKIKANEEDKIKNVAYLSLILIAGVNVLFIMFAPELILFFAPKEYYEAIYIIPPISMSVYFMYAYSLFALFEFFYEKTKYISVATLLGAILNILLNGFFLKKYGYMAAAYTTLVCYIIYSVMHLIFMLEICREKGNEKVYDIKILGLITFLFVLSGFGIMLLYKNREVRLVLLAICICISFLVLFINRTRIGLLLKSIKNPK